MSEFQLPRNRDAWATIRGFIYQIELTIDRWLRLDDRYDLELERGEDIDIVRRAWEVTDNEAERILEQIKHRDRSVTLRSEEALTAIASFAEHRAENPTRKLVFRFITNAVPKRERPSPLARPQTGIGAWESVRTGIIAVGTTKELLVGGIRRLLHTAKRPKDLNASTWKHLKDYVTSDDAGLEALILDFEWSTGQIAYNDLAPKLQADLRSLGHAADDQVAEYQFFRLFLHISKALSKPGVKRLTTAERDGLLRLPPPDLVENARIRKLGTTIDSLRGTIEQHELQLAAMKSQLQQFGERLLSALGRSPGIIGGEPPPDISIPVGVIRIARRTATVASVRARLMRCTWTAVHGGLGSGKTELAILLASALERPPPWIRLRDLAADAALARLRAAIQDLGVDLAASSRAVWYGSVATRLGAGGVIVLDDVPRIQVGDEFTEELIHAVIAYAQADVHLLTTSVHPPPQSLHDKLGSALQAVPAPMFTKEEVRALLVAHGAPTLWLEDIACRKIQRRTGGYPVLVMKAIKALVEADWPALERLDELVAGPNIDRETLRRLLSSVRNPERLEFLRRLTLVIGSIGLEEAQAVAAVPPEIGAIQQHLDELSGMWLQPDSKSRYFISPLLRDLGETELTPSTRRSVHGTLGQGIIEKKRLGTFDVLAAIYHFEHAESPRQAAVLLCWALHEVRESKDLLSARLLLGRWFREPPPASLDAGLRLYLRGLQIAIADLVGEPSEALDAEVEATIATDLAYAEAWAAIAVVVIATPVIASRDLPRANAIFTAALRHLATAQLPDQSQRIADLLPIPLEQWIWQLSTFIRSERDLDSWLEVLIALTPEQRASAIRSELYPSVCMAIADPLWMGEARKPESHRQWENVDVALRWLAERAIDLGLEPLWAWAVRARIVIAAEYTGRMNDALILGEQALARASNEATVQFALHDILGNEYLLADRPPDARKHLQFALEQQIDDFVPLRIRSTIALSAAVGVEDRSAAVTVVERALALTRNEPELPELEIIRVLGEVAIARWLANGVASAFADWDEAAERLVTAKVSAPAWRALFMIFGHVSGYLTSLASRGQPPDTINSGDVYVAPAPMMFLRYRETAGGLYDESKFAPIFVQLSLFAEAVRNDQRAAEWALRGFDHACEVDDVTSIAVLAPKLSQRLAALGRFSEAIDVAITGGRATVEGIQASARRGDLPEWFDLSKIVDETARRGRAEHIAMIVTILPIVLHLARLSVEEPTTMQDKAGDAVAAYQLIAETAVDPALWNDAAQLLENIFLRRVPALKLKGEAARFRQAYGEAFHAAAYVGATLQDDCELKYVANIHWEIHLSLLQNANSRTIDRTFLAPLIETFWGAVVKEQRYRFSSPSLVADAFTDAFKLAAPDRSEAILQAVAAGLGVSLRKA